MIKTQMTKWNQAPDFLIKYLESRIKKAGWTKKKAALHKLGIKSYLKDGKVVESKELRKILDE